MEYDSRLMKILSNFGYFISDCLKDRASYYADILIPFSEEELETSSHFNELSLMPTLSKDIVKLKNGNIGLRERGEVKRRIKLHLKRLKECSLENYQEYREIYKNSRKY